MVPVGGSSPRPSRVTERYQAQVAQVDRGGAMAREGARVNSARSVPAWQAPALWRRACRASLSVRYMRAGPRVRTPARSSTCSIEFQPADVQRAAWRSTRASRHAKGLHTGHVHAVDGLGEQADIGPAPVAPPCGRPPSAPVRWPMRIQFSVHAQCQQVGCRRRATTVGRAGCRQGAGRLR